MKPAFHQAIDDFFRQYPERQYRKGQILILAGETTPAGFYLVSGRVRAYNVTYRGEERVVHSFIAPALFPLSLIVHGSEAAYIYEASTDITIRQAPVEAVLKLLHTNPTVVYELLSELCKAFDNVLERVVYATSSSARSRLVYSLIAECRESGMRQQNGSYVVALNERELGARAGLSRETVSREAKMLKITKLIEIHHNEVVIPNLARLERYLKLHG
jgi:CRP/FNR family transcriptional regulator